MVEPGEGQIGNVHLKSIIKEADRCLFERLLGSRWNELSKPVRALHDPDAQVQRRGSFTICHGTHRLARLIVRLMRLPREGTDVPTELMIEPRGRGERWHRRFGDDDLVTWLRPAGPNGCLAERLGIIECLLGLDVAAGGVSYRTIQAALVIGPWRRRLPRWLSPCVDGSETPGPGDLVHVKVQLSLPPVGVLMSYTGDVRVDRKEPA